MPLDPAAASRRFLTLQQVADELNVSHAQVYALVRDRSLVGMKIGGRGQWRVERDRLEDYIQQLYADVEPRKPGDLPDEVSTAIDPVPWTAAADCRPGP